MTPSCTAVLLNVYWGENNAWYALAVQTGAEAPGPGPDPPHADPWCLSGSGEKISPAEDFPIGSAGKLCYTG